VEDRVLEDAVLHGNGPKPSEPGVPKDVTIQPTVYFPVIEKCKHVESNGPIFPGMDSIERVESSSLVQQTPSNPILPSKQQSPLPTDACSISSSSLPDRTRSEPIRRKGVNHLALVEFLQQQPSQTSYFGLIGSGVCLSQCNIICSVEESPL
jgi:hypothetical protein